MAKPYIFGTTIIRQELRFLASEYHRHHGDDHVYVETLYRVSRSEDGSGSTEWLLTRFRTASGMSASAILLVEENNGEKYLTEFFCKPRKQEAAMIEAWKAFMEEEE